MTRFNEYMIYKEASTGEGIAEAAGQGIAALLPYILGAPLAAGTAVGYLASRMTSPGDSDIQALQKRVMDTDIREKLALSKRRLEDMRRRVQEDQQVDTMATSRQRDMFV